MIKKTLSIASILFLITSCGPVYKKEYTFIPPQKAIERTCANNCLKNKDICMQKCNDRSTYMDIGNNIMSMIDSEKSYSRSYKSNKIKEECHETCNQSHRNCHENCGGKVIEKQICVFNCKGAK
jgi:hypothetical protein